MRLEELKRLLDSYGISPVKSRGQHFLFDEDVVRKMADAARITEGDRVVEIGPGWGILTGELLGRGAHVVAVELDRRFSGLLTDRFGASRLVIRQADVRSLSNADLTGSFVPAAERYKVVANLPYSITSEVLQRFLLEDPKPVSMTVMVQREVAERVTSGPGAMSSLAVMVQILGSPRIVTRVPRGSFHPQPKVDSAVLHIDVLGEDELGRRFDGVDNAHLFALVRQAFSQRRKKLRNSLSSAIKGDRAVEDVFDGAEIRPDARPEELSVDDWFRLSRALN